MLTYITGSFLITQIAESIARKHAHRGEPVRLILSGATRAEIKHAVKAVLFLVVVAVLAPSIFLFMSTLGEIASGPAAHSRVVCCPAADPLPAHSHTTTTSDPESHHQASRATRDLFLLVWGGQ